MDVTIIKISVPALLAFVSGIALTPLITHYLYHYRVWKTEGGKVALNGDAATEFNRLKGSTDAHTPRMGGIVIWGAVLLTTSILIVGNLLFADPVFDTLSFFSRAQTWIPLATLFIGALVGFLNDLYDITHTKRGIPLRVRLGFVAVLAGSIAWWFYSRLEVTSIGVPGVGPWEIGWLIIPVFILFALAVYASGVIDGIDGLSGGVFAAIFTAYTGIAFIQMQYDLAALCATLVGAILAFLWFNIPPARFYMTETGTMALTLTLAVVAFMTDSLGDGYGISMLPIVATVLVLTVLSNIIQLSYRKATGKKFFRIAPFHHHLEAIGWPSHKVTMRYWVVTVMTGLLGVALTALLTL